MVYSLAPPLVKSADSAIHLAQLQAWLDEKGGSVNTDVRNLAAVLASVELQT